MDITTVTTILKYVIAATAAVLSVAIILQPKEGGLGTSFGGSGGGGEAYRTKRGLEKVLHRVTILGVVVFAVSALALAALSV